MWFISMTTSISLKKTFIKKSIDFTQSIATKLGDLLAEKEKMEFRNKLLPIGPQTSFEQYMVN